MADPRPPAPDLSPAQRALDVLARVAGAAWFGFLAVGMLWVRMRPLAQRGLSDPEVLRDLAVLAVDVAFYAMLVVLFLVRRDPARKAPGPWPRLAGFLGAFGLLFLGYLPARTEPGLLWAAAALSLSAHALMIAALAWLGRSFSIFPEARRLVTTGPYAWVRHPLYLAEALAATALVLVHLSWVSAAAGLAWAAVQAARMLAEERVLEQAFPEYADYRRRVKRLLPGIW